MKGDLPAPWRTLLLPDGAFVLMLNFADPQGVCERDDLRRRRRFQRGWISGQQLQPLVIEQAGRCDFVGIKFRPGGAFPLLGGDIEEFTGRVVELEDIWGAAAARLRERMGDAPADGARLQLLEPWLARRLAARAPDPRVRFAAAQLLHRGEGRIGEIARTLGISHKHLVTQFRRQVGVTPRWFARVARLQRLIAHVGFAAQPDWADAAQACGYCDQSHLTNEFRDLTGLTPATYLARRSPYLGYLSSS